MKKWVISLTLAASVIGLAACNGDNEAIVKTKAGNVTKDELYNTMKDRIGEQVVQQLVLDKVLSKEYSVSDKELDERLEEIKAEVGPQFDMLLQQAGYADEDDYRQLLKLNMLQEKAALKDIKVTDEEVKEYYEQSEPNIEVRHIIVEPDDEKLAKEIKTKLDKGEDFAELAAEYSIDGTSQTGGDLGSISRDDPNMDEDFKKAAFDLKQNVVSDPIKTQYGWHIIEVTDKPEKKPFDEVKDEYEKELKLSKMDNETVQKSLKKEFENANVKIEDKDLQSALDEILKADDESEDTETEEEK